MAQVRLSEPPSSGILAYHGLHRKRPSSMEGNIFKVFTTQGILVMRAE
ncbi:DUF221 domain protein [Aspergillus luchuensis]|uniref:DUF221 domain protein n=1 Tax=Aspergillus kawachii TaxID=1069201 RepID=A0A146FYI1_ASPKA|nr:DUF221 domain protein [Aspergillus luchuensis]